MKLSIMNLVVFILTSCCMLGLPAYGQAPNLLTKQDGKFYKVEIFLDDEDILTSPPEGFWSIATAWKQGWPADWVHSKPTEIEHIENWTILRGKLETSAGTWRISDSYRPEGGVVKCIRRFIWEGKETVKCVTLSVRFQCRGKGSAACLPGILYHGNPSGAKSGRGHERSGLTFGALTCAIRQLTGPMVVAGIDCKRAWDGTGPSFRALRFQWQTKCYQGFSAWLYRL
jgi:hypothetical protein